MSPVTSAQRASGGPRRRAASVGSEEATVPGFSLACVRAGRGWRREGQGRGGTGGGIIKLPSDFQGITVSGSSNQNPPCLSSRAPRASKTGLASRKPQPATIGRAVVSSVKPPPNPCRRIPTASNRRAGSQRRAKIRHLFRTYAASSSRSLRRAGDQSNPVVLVLSSAPSRRVPRYAGGRARGGSSAPRLASRKVEIRGEGFAVGVPARPEDRQ